VVGTASLQYIIELALGCQRDVPQCPMSSASKLERLKQHRMAWKNLKYSREYQIPMGDGNLWELSGGVLAQNTSDGTIQFYQLASDLRFIEEKIWTIGPNLGVAIRDFGMDPSQDLLVLVQDPDW